MCAPRARTPCWLSDLLNTDPPAKTEFRPPVKVEFRAFLPFWNLTTGTADARFRPRVPGSRLRGLPCGSPQGWLWWAHSQSEAESY